MQGLGHFASLLALVAGSVPSLGCTVGQGEGWVKSDKLAVPDCWNDAFDLQPDFFATVPYRDTQQIRVQHGSDLQEVSDGVALQVNAVTTVREGMLDQPVDVGMAPELWEDVNPGSSQGAPTPLVNLALYLQFSCHNQNIVLYATSGTMTFSSLFSGDPSEREGSEKLTEASFDVMVGDPRDAAEGTRDIPAEKLSPLQGYLRFQFVRGEPGQPFP
jgi:hypothetical protein